MLPHVSQYPFYRDILGKCYDPIKAEESIMEPDEPDYTTPDTLEGQMKLAAEIDDVDGLLELTNLSLAQIEHNMALREIEAIEQGFQPLEAQDWRSDERASDEYYAEQEKNTGALG